MPERSARRAAARRLDDEDEEFSEGGMVARLADRAFDNPAMSGGLLVMALTAAAIVSNAMFLQKDRHPDPLFMTRPGPAATTTTSAPEPAAVPLPRARVEHTAPMPPSAAAEETLPPPPTRPASAGSTLIADIQRGLALRGLYSGAVDGIAGSRTKAAISAYQKAEGLPVTGQPSPAVLERLTSAAPSTPAPTTSTPAPAAVEPAASPPPMSTEAPVAAPAPEPAASPAPEARAAPHPTVAATESAPVEEAPPSSTPGAEPMVEEAPAPDPVAAAERERFLSVQGALNEIGYGPLPLSGVFDENTSDAIRRFELDNGLPLTGKLGAKVINRLVAIGAMKPV